MVLEINAMQQKPKGMLQIYYPVQSLMFHLF